MKRYRTDILGPSVDGLRPRWIYGTSTDEITARAQYATATGAVRLTELTATSESPIERVIATTEDK